MSKKTKESEMAVSRNISGSAMGRPYSIVCVNPHTFEGVTFNKGDISDHSWGMPIPDGWRKATQQDINEYIDKKRTHYR